MEGYNPMAKAIENYKPEFDEKLLIQDELARLVENLSTSKVTELLNALLENGPQSTSVIVEKMNNPSTRQGIENLARFLGLAGQLDPKLLRGLQSGLSATSEILGSKRSPTFMELFRTMRSAEVRRGIAMGLAFVAGIGSKS